MTDERYIYTDETEDVAGSVRHALRCAAFVSEDPQAWKWGLLALHSALQGACVCHLTTTAAPIGAVTRRNAVEWINYFKEARTNETAKPPTTWLMDLPELLKAVRKKGSCGGISNSSKVEVSDSELVWLGRIHCETRNQFVHFEPLGWSIEVSGIPKIGQTISRIIKDIHDCGWAFRHLDVIKRDAMILDLERLTEASWST